MSLPSLIFTSKTIAYRCHTSTLNVGGAIYNDHYGPARLPDVFYYPNRQSTPESPEWLLVWTTWWSVIRQYSPRSVSFPSDRLVACGGIAEKFHPALKSDYLAGLWRDTLLRDLLWTRDFESAHFPRPVEYRAPSWSWAAVEGGQITLFPVITSDTWRGAEDW
ncbi:hypothetical protein C8Q77DRAFT_1159393 [Trametes polyzona]|nr:hypothetical protein C8Q77DRAFT_1159393 [Trametes polyzona]